MITNDFIQGYVAALDNISVFLNSICSGKDYNYIKTIGDVNSFVRQTKENYKQLVKELNEAQSKETK
jgi:aminoglycoside phosphotransferase family enzyme